MKRKLQMTTTKRTVKNPAKAGTLSKKVIQDAVNAVAEKATDVANKATPKKPTIKSLQQEVANITEQLVFANKLCLTQEIDIANLQSDNEALEREIVRLNASIRHRDEVILKLEVPFYRKIFNLFGN